MGLLQPHSQAQNQLLLESEHVCQCFDQMARQVFSHVSQQADNHTSQLAFGFTHGRNREQRLWGEIEMSAQVAYFNLIRKSGPVYNY